MTIEIATNAQQLSAEAEAHTARGVIRGTVNGDALHAELTMKRVPSAGLQQVLVRFHSLPREFHPLAASGSPFASWSNSGSPVGAFRALPLDHLSGGNYYLQRRNIFPDGSVLELGFESRATGPDALEMEMVPADRAPVHVLCP